MANLTNVDGAKIRGTAQKLAGIEADIHNNVGKIADVIERLNKGWSSPVKVQFMSVYEEDAEALVELLEQAAQDFEATEDEMVSEVGKLK